MLEDRISQGWLVSMLTSREISATPLMLHQLCCFFILLIMFVHYFRSEPSANSRSVFQQTVVCGHEQRGFSSSARGGGPPLNSR